MVAVSRYFPDDPKQKESVHAVLREHPELPDFIARVSEKATEMFSEVSIALDAERYAPTPTARAHHSAVGRIQEDF